MKITGDMRKKMEDRLPFQTPRLRLRPLASADLSQLVGYRNQPEVARFQSWERFTTRDAEKLYAQQILLEFNSDDIRLLLNGKRTGQWRVILVFIFLMRAGRLNWV